jgi:hypothetical protein
MFFWFTTGGVLSSTIQPSLNLRLLQIFYEDHRMSEPFLYVHPIRGSRTVRFAKPLPRLLPIPEKVTRDPGTGGRGHQVQPFSIQLIDNP